MAKTKMTIRISPLNKEYVEKIAQMDGRSASYIIDQWTEYKRLKAERKGELLKAIKKNQQENENF